MRLSESHLRELGEFQPQVLPQQGWVHDTLTRALVDGGVADYELQLSGSAATNTQITSGDQASGSDIDYLLRTPAFSIEDPDITPRERWTGFRDTVRTALTEIPGADVKQGRKCIKMDLGGIPVDITPVLEMPDGDLTFFLSEPTGRQIVTDPDTHRMRWHEQEAQSNGELGVLTRALKHIRGLAGVRPEDASSFHLACLAYEASRTAAGSVQDGLRRIFDIAQSAGLTDVMTVNGRETLLGNGPTQWNPDQAVRSLSSIAVATGL